MKTTAKIIAMLLVLALAASASARVITVEVTGVVDLVDTDGGFALDGSVGLGSVMTGFTTYDTDTANLGDSITGLYNLISISMTIGNYTFMHDPMSVDPPLFRVSTVDPVYIASSDALRFDGTITVDGTPKIYDDITWYWTYLELFNLGTSSSEYIPTAALPDLESWPDLSVFDTYRRFETHFLGEGSDYFGIRGEITSLTVIPEPAMTYYVNAAEGSDNNDGLSPETPFATIQKAIDSAYNGDTVLVADGNYTGDGNRDLDFHGKPITVRSESGPENCIIDCQRASRGFYFHNYEDEKSVVTGFTITNGYSSWAGAGIYCEISSPTITNCTIRGNSAEWAGGGISCDVGSSPTITNCAITDNSAGHWGGGISCWRDSSPTITNCAINGNSAEYDSGGIDCYISSSPTITNCAITDNSAGYWGGGISCLWESSPTISNCTISNNFSSGGGGIYCWRQSSPTITNCTIIGNSVVGNGDNTGFGGGIDSHYSSPTIANCTISGNSAEWSGGGINCQSSSNATITNCTITSNTARTGGGIGCGYTRNLIITNCKITGNSAYYCGGGIFCRDNNTTIANCTFAENSSSNGNTLACDSWAQMYPSSVQVTNCILWDGGDEIWNNDGSTITITYSDIQGGYSGEGNIDSDPCFVDLGYWVDKNDPNIIVEPNDPNAIWIDGDYHLLPDSPCIDSGDNNSVPADIHDLDGDGNTAEPLPFDLDGNPRFVDRPDIEDTGNGTPPIVDMGAYEAMVSCFGVNHVKLGTKAGKKGNKVEVKGTFDPASPIDFAVDDVTYIIDDGLGYILTFIIPAGSFELEGKGDKDKYKFHSPKGSQPGIKARFDFLKCKFELKVKGVMDTSEITAETLAIVLQAGANIAREIVELEFKGKKGEHLEYKRKPKFECCPEM